MADINNEFHHRLYSKKYAYITDTIVKYSPNGYDRNGCYKKKDEWTSISDVYEKPSMLDRYLSVERQYIDTIRTICNMTQCHFLTLIPLSEGEELYKSDILSGDEENIEPRILQVMKQKRVSVNDIDEIIRLSLRELLHVCLANHSKHIFVYFGYDFYMYIMSEIDDSVLYQVVRKKGLYLNPRSRLSLNDIFYNKLKKDILGGEGEYLMSQYINKMSVNWYLAAQFIYRLTLKILHNCHMRKHCYIKFPIEKENPRVKDMENICPYIVICRTLPKFRNFKYLNDINPEFSTSVLDFYQNENDNIHSIYMSI